MGPTSYIDNSVRSFLLSLAQRGPEPAGGAALAVAGASAAALVSLACHTADRHDAGGPADEMVSACHAASGELSRRIEALVDEDVEAYRQVRKALGQRRNGDPVRQETYQADLNKALEGAVRVPLELAEACLEVMELASQTMPSVAPPIVGDLVAAVHLAEAAIAGSLRNARINASSLSDEATRRDATARVEEVALRFEQQRARTANVLTEAAPEYAEDA